MHFTVNNRALVSVKEEATQSSGATPGACEV